MTELKDRLRHLSELAKGPELIWPDVSDVALLAAKRIEDLEAETERMAAVIRFYTRKALKEKETSTTPARVTWMADKPKETQRKPVEETAVARAARYLNDGLDCDLIALRMNIGVGTVYTYLSKARHRGLINRAAKVPMGKKSE